MDGMTDNGATGELAEFLRSRRGRIGPADVGLDPESRRRRVPGLRREELAQLAGVSVAYYTRLEQGRSRSASPAVLDALADALQLDDVERSHLLTISRPRPRRRRRARPQQVEAATLALLENLDRVRCPSFVLGRRLDVLAHNELAGALITRFRALPAAERNQARFVFLEPHARELYVDWPTVAADTTAMLRLDAGRHPDDPQLGVLIGDLSIRSAEFRRLWSDQRVHRRTTGTKSYHHPLVGDLTVTYQALIVGADPDQTVIVYTTARGSASETALRLLAERYGAYGASTGPREGPPAALERSPAYGRTSGNGDGSDRIDPS